MNEQYLVRTTCVQETVLCVGMSAFSVSLLSVRQTGGYMFSVLIKVFQI